jgi:hypothetical protein
MTALTDRFATAAEFLAALDAFWGRNGYRSLDHEGRWLGACPACRSKSRSGESERFPLAVIEEGGHWTVGTRCGCSEARIVAALTEGESREPPWFESAADLLREPDPGPTPFLVERFLVDGAIAAVQGSHKVGKTWLLAELALSIVTGQPAFGRFAVPEPGPVLLVVEESGRAALHRRLSALCRGRRLDDPDDLRDLYYAANRRVRLDDPSWQKRLLDAAARLAPRAVIFDPLARVKGASVDEDKQKEMAPILDFMRALRDESGAAVAFSHHTPHDARRLRGTTDLEAYWESKVSVRRESGGLVTLESEHREAEAGEDFSYRLAWHEESRSMLLAPVEEESASGSRPAARDVSDRVLAALRSSAEPISLNAVRREAKGRKEAVSNALRTLAESGLVEEVEQRWRAVPKPPEPPDQQGQFPGAVPEAVPAAQEPGGTTQPGGEGGRGSARRAAPLGAPREPPRRPEADEKESSKPPALSDGSCRCRTPARSPRAAGPDYCQTCKRPVADAPDLAVLDGGAT